MATKLALFDFDGTITTKDTLLEIGKFYVGNTRFLINMFFLLPWLILLKARLLVNWKVKEKYLSTFFGGLTDQQFEKICIDFSKEIVPNIVRPKSIDTIRQLQEKGFDVYIVSASATDWIRPWASLLNVSVLATELERKNGVITGKLEGKNCYGPEKVNKVNSIIDLKKYDEIFAYGDSSGDREMFTLASETHYKPFRN